MSKINKSIEIVSSTQPGLSSMSETSRMAAQTALAKVYTHVSITIINSIDDLDELVARKPDMVFLGMSFLPQDPALGRSDSQKIWISDYLDENEIAYTGSNQYAHLLERNKPLSKQRVLDAGLNTSLFAVLEVGYMPTKDEIKLTYPLFVKPADLGGGAGIDSRSVVHTYEQLVAKVTAVHTRLRTSCLVEQYLSGREFSVAILKKELMAGYDVMPLELIAPQDKNGNRLLSGSVKSADTERFQPVNSPLLKQSLSNLALDVFHALRARDYGRIDIRLDAQDVPQFLEANLIPSLIDGYGNFPKACLLNGIAYETMLAQIVRLALARTQPVTDANPVPVYQLAAATGF
jgi:D-alanine-D-alanine ligase